MDTDAVLISAVSAALGILASGLVGYYFWKRGSRGPFLKYAVSSVPLVEGTGDLEIRYRGEIVSAVTTTYVAVWNAGPESIREADVVEPVAVSVEADRLLDAAIVAATRAEIRAGVAQDTANTATLKFSHLDQGDGVTLRLLHTGPASASPDVGSVIVGMPTGPQALKSQLHRNYGMPVFTTIVVVLSFAVGAYLILPVFAEDTVRGLIGGALALIFPAFFLLIGRSNIRNDVRQLPEPLRDVNYRKASYGPIPKD